MSLIESTVEDAALEWFGELGFAFGHGPHPAPGELAAERKPERSGASRRHSFGEVVLEARLREAIRRLTLTTTGEASAGANLIERQETVAKSATVQIERGAN
jgi:type I restriction enzyme, R subunit